MNKVGLLVITLGCMPVACMQQSSDSNAAARDEQDVSMVHQHDCFKNVGNEVVGLTRAAAYGALSAVGYGISLKVHAVVARCAAHIYEGVDGFYWRLPFVKLGAALGCVTFVYSNHKPVIDATAKRAYQFAREKSPIVIAGGKRAYQFACDQINKERDWQMIDALLDSAI